MFNVAFSLLLVALALNAESSFGTNQGIDNTVEEKKKADLLLCYKEDALLYKSKCYFLIQGSMKYREARKLCTEKGGRPADILNSIHQYMVAYYVRDNSNATVDIWLGMTYKISTGTLLFSDGNDVTGDVAASFIWQSKYPQQGSGRDGFVINVAPTNYGFANISPMYSCQGILCEK